MKLKKVVISVLIAIIVFGLSSSCFAMSELPIKRKVENTVPDERFENRVKSQNTTTQKDTENTVDNTVSKEDKEDTENKKDEENTSKKDEKTEENKEETQKVIYKTEINEDVFNSEKDVEYKSTYINGNLFIASTNEVKIRDSKIDGDLMILADKAEFENVIVNGNIFLAVSKDAILDVEANSLYGTIRENLNIKETSKISKDVRIISNNVELSGDFERSVYILAKSAEITDETKISGNLDITASSIDVSEDATIKGDVKKVIKEIKPLNINMQYYLPETVTEFVIILVVAIFILGGFPKFTEVNNNLKLRDFVKSFFTGILGFFVSILIALGLFALGFGIGYAILLIALTIILIGLGKLIFIVAFAIRISGKPEKISKVKVFFMTIFVALIVEAIGLVAVFGMPGFIAASIFNAIIGISGFGSLIKVILSPRKKTKIKKNIDSQNENKALEVEKKQEQDDKAGQAELQAEVKKEIKEEINELQTEREEEKKTTSTQEEVKAEINEEPKLEQNEENKETLQDDENKDEK